MIRILVICLFVIGCASASPTGPLSNEECEAYAKQLFDLTFENAGESERLLAYEILRDKHQALIDRCNEGAIDRWLFNCVMQLDSYDQLKSCLK